MKSVVLLSPEAHFSEAVKEAIENKQIKTQPAVEVYLIQLLRHYLESKNFNLSHQTDSGQKPPETFAEMYLQALNSEDARRHELMRAVADKTLYLTGFFSDSLQRRTMDIDYYVEIGSAAYFNLHTWCKEDTLAHVYKTFSSRFMDFVEVLNYISEKSMIQSDQNVLKLYDRYLRTGSELARDKLIELGVVPVSKEHLKLSKA